VKLPRVARTSAFRLALIYAAIFTVSSLLLFGTLYLRVTQYAYDQMRNSIAAEIESLVEEFRVDGIGQVAREVDERSRSAESSSSYYLLQSSKGERISGNIQPIARRFGNLEIRVSPLGPDRSRPEIAVPALLRSVALPSGELLAIGRDLADLRELNRLITQAFVFAILGSAGVAIAGGMALGFGFVQRIEAISKTTQTIISGHLAQRIPVKGSDDELDRLSTTLNDMLDRIEMLMETTRQVSNDIAHDLRTPLSRLRRRMEALVLSEAEPSVLRAEVTAAIGELDEILSTFTALLRIAEIEAHGRRSGFADTDLSGLFSALAETYQPVAEDAGQDLKSSIQDGIVVHGDTDLLTQLLSNLIENAIRHCPAGSTIRLDLRHNAAGGAVGSVSDDGPGIPADEQQKVFRRFYRLERSRTTPGSGLGLALSAAVADVHGVTLTLRDNAPGARFELFFPELVDRNTERTHD
jgi:signal transduction histidine kinase